MIKRGGFSSTGYERPYPDGNNHFLFERCFVFSKNRFFNQKYYREKREIWEATIRGDYLERAFNILEKNRL